jgi:hypothetical protein
MTSIKLSRLILVKTHLNPNGNIGGRYKSCMMYGSDIHTKVMKNRKYTAPIHNFINNE